VLRQAVIKKRVKEYVKSKFINFLKCNPFLATRVNAMQFFLKAKRGHLDYGKRENGSRSSL